MKSLINSLSILGTLGANRTRDIRISREKKGQISLFDSFPFTLDYSAHYGVMQTNLNGNFLLGIAIVHELGRLCYLAQSLPDRPV